MNTSRGAFSIVKECTHNKSGEKYAVKILHTRGNKIEEAEVEQEIDLLKKVSHKHIVTMKDHYKLSDTYYIVMELYESSTFKLVSYCM